jgi:NAD-dependent SIR2 family protein deacetylase
MATFLDVAEDLLSKEKFRHDAEAVESIGKVFEMLGHLQPVYAKSSLDLQNIESVFGAVEMGKVLNRFLHYTGDQVNDLRAALVTLIVRTLEKTVRFPIHRSKDGGSIVPAPPFRSLAELFAKLGRCAVITFNYDLALDFAMEAHPSIQLNYALEDSGSGMNLLKLHGSLNWVKCSSCDKISTFSAGDYLADLRHSLPDHDPHIYFDIVDRLRDESCPRCGSQSAFALPLLVPPTWSKGEYPELRNVWHQAAEELRTAQNIYVVGYSLPDTDAFFRYLFAISTVSQARIRRFWVFNPDPEREATFRRLVGEGIRTRFKYEPLRFEAVPKFVRDRIP